MMMAMMRHVESLGSGAVSLYFRGFDGEWRTYVSSSDISELGHPPR